MNQVKTHVFTDEGMLVVNMSECGFELVEWPEDLTKDDAENALNNWLKEHLNVLRTAPVAQQPLH